MYFTMFLVTFTILYPTWGPPSLKVWDMKVCYIDYLIVPLSTLQWPGGPHLILLVLTYVKMDFRQNVLLHTQWLAYILIYKDNSFWRIWSTPTNRPTHIEHGIQWVPVDGHAIWEYHHPLLQLRSCTIFVTSLRSYYSVRTNVVIERNTDKRRSVGKPVDTEILLQELRELSSSDYSRAGIHLCRHASTHGERNRCV